MLFSGRRIVLALVIIITAVGIVLLVRPNLFGTTLAAVIVVCGGLAILALNFFRASGRAPLHEPDDVADLSDARVRELIRGTSFHLREMDYRYSVRYDPAKLSDRRRFNAEVNTVHLGFVPAVITDNTTDRQGFGYVAFVYDQKRWRGPGLPCPDGQAEAVRHAALCVSPLSKEEETRFDAS
jgi:hypothetical protein